jgi:two-component system phosphate regulon response regulator PhoB
MTAAKPLLLIAEDDETLRSGLVEAFGSEGYEVTGVANGATALDRIKTGSRRPNLLLLDLKMPALSGWGFLHMREADPSLLMIPVVILSGEVGSPPGIGPVTFVRKPIEFGRLRNIVARVLTESATDPDTLPRRGEPWSVDRDKPHIVRNRFGHAVAFVASDAEARRLVAAVNFTSDVSTEALEQCRVEAGAGEASARGYRESAEQDHS